MRKQPLLTRTQLREGTFARDGNKCVMCGASDKLDAHHITERRLWKDGGYYLDNGVTLCDPTCHTMAEQTVISCETLREKAGIKSILLPEHLDASERWDKWGNPYLPNGQRLQGELFFDESVQNVLAPVLSEFTNRVKYPRTHHLPWSPGASADDCRVADTKVFDGMEVVITVKMDGENTTIYKDGMHARSLIFTPHPSRTKIRALAAEVGPELTDSMRLCGENLYATHSIHYTNLPGHFLLFSVWDRNIALSWDETEEWATLLNLPLVPVLYRGIWDEKLVRGLYNPVFNGNPCEGYVVRPARAFTLAEFKTHVAKFVRKGHVQTDEHWMNAKIVPNELSANE